MKKYDTNDIYDYLCDRGISRSGSQELLKIEIKIWNFIANIVNKFKSRRRN